MKQLRALLINPYIYDVSAYSFWSAPLGLLYVGSILRENGIDIQLLDCLAVDEAKRKEDGRAPFIHAKVAKPEAAAIVKKRFKRYGISPEEFRAKLRCIETPDLILITSIMTYWYSGVVEALTIARDVFPRAKIIVGGLYPSLCSEHAGKHLAADLIVKNGLITMLYTYIEEEFSRPLSFKPDTDELSLLPYPCFDLYEKPASIPLLTSLGCPYHCTYCATHYLHPRLVRRQPRDVLRELSYWRERGCNHFALYDDSFLFEKERYAKPFLRGVYDLSPGVSFHNPNALNASLIDEESALLLKNAGFSEVRIGLETADARLQKETGGKIDTPRFEMAISNLERAGFDGASVCVYVLAGLPLQRASDVRKTIDYAGGLGLRVSLAEYSPIPHTHLFNKYHALARYPVAADPLFQNNALFPFAWEGFTEEELDELKGRVRDLNGSLDRKAGDRSSARIENTEKG